MKRLFLLLPLTLVEAFAGEGGFYSFSRPAYTPEAKRYVETLERTAQHWQKAKQIQQENVVGALGEFVTFMESLKPPPVGGEEIVRVAEAIVRGLDQERQKRGVRRPLERMLANDLLTNAIYSPTTFSTLEALDQYQSLLKTSFAHLEAKDARAILFIYDLLDRPVVGLHFQAVAQEEVGWNDLLE